MKNGIYFLLGVVLIFASKSDSHQCDRTPEKAAKPANRVNFDRYVIEISGDPKGYTPEKNYTITLRSNPTSRTEYRFYEFTLVAESEYPSSIHQGRLAGDFYLINPILTMFNFKCPNTVIQTNSFTKTNISVLWKAPPPGSGCVAIKATVFENGDNWFMDDGPLTQILCEDSDANEDIQPKIQEQCCACNEAKYEVAFQGLWSRNTHPKDFPYDIYKTKLGDIIGASHKYTKSFWNYGEMASRGLKLLAEEGDTSELENELKEMVKSDDIRTIIKARELSNPTTGTSYTVFRVDQDNHLISLVSKITPSPDWIVGVANLELCLENCSWAEKRILNLYPWDVGTDNGETYNSPDSPSIEPQPIQRIGPHIPNWEEYPFYDKDGEPIKPIAKLHLTRQKLYEKDCKPVEKQHINSRNFNCNFGDWSEWSGCSVTCGKGVMTRDRPLLPSKHYKQCAKDPNVINEMQETAECDTYVACDNEAYNSENDCPNTMWGPWTECSVTCGVGVKTRTRQETSEMYNENEDYEDVNEEDENENMCMNYKEEVECKMPPCSFGDISPEGQIIDQSPDGEVIDCQVSKWSVWGPCDTSVPCKKRYKVKERHILVHPQNGGKACPKKLQKKKKCGCKKVYSGDGTNPTFGINSSTEKDVDCEMGPWSEWSPCSTTCGRAVRQKTRNVLRYAKGNGKPCGPRIKQELCPLPLACTGKSGMSEFYGK